MSKTKAAGDVPQVPANPAPTPTITHYQQIAVNLANALDDMLSLVPSFVASHPSTVGFVRSHQNVSVDFIATAIAAVEANPELQGTGNFDVTEARDALQFIEAFRPMADRLNAAAQNLTFSIDSRKANAANGALQIYAIAKGVARNPVSTTVASHVGNLRRDLGKAGKGGRKKAPATPATPTPAPASIPVPPLPIPAVIGGLSVQE